jgi:ankyrin repeat protein
VFTREITAGERIVRGCIETVARGVGNVFTKRRSKKSKLVLQNELCHAARIGDVLEVKRLLTAYLEGIDINGRDGLGVVPLHAAVEGGQLLVVQIITRLSVADVNVRDEYGNSPLMAAVMYGQQRITAYLVQGGRVDVNCQNKDGKTALHIAEKVSHEIREVMTMTLALSEKVKCDLKDASGKIPFQESPAIIQKFREKQAEYARIRAAGIWNKERL